MRSHQVVCCQGCSTGYVINETGCSHHRESNSTCHTGGSSIYSSHHMEVGGTDILTLKNSIYSINAIPCTNDTAKYDSESPLATSETSSFTLDWASRSQTAEIKFDSKEWLGLRDTQQGVHGTSSCTSNVCHSKLMMPVFLDQPSPFCMLVQKQSQSGEDSEWCCWLLSWGWDKKRQMLKTINTSVGNN